MKLICSGVLPDHLVVIHDQVIRHMKLAERHTHGRYNASDMMDLVYLQKSWLFCALDVEDPEDIRVLASIVATRADYPRKSMLLIQFVGGDKLKLWRHNMGEVLFDFVEKEGLAGIEGFGRLGWARIFPFFRIIGMAGEVGLEWWRGQQRAD